MLVIGILFELCLHDQFVPHRQSHCLSLVEMNQFMLVIGILFIGAII
jgi:hypothetical protein